MPSDSAPSTQEAPTARRIPHLVKSPHGDRVDEYYWMRDDDPKVKRAEIVEYLAAENTHTEAMLTPSRRCRHLVAEMRARIKEDDSSVPVYDNGYWSWRRFTIGAEYPMILRRRGGPTDADPAAPEEMVLDIARAGAHAYYNVGGPQSARTTAGSPIPRTPSVAACTRCVCAIW